MSGYRVWWFKYGPELTEDARMKKLRTLAPEAYICFLDLILLVINADGYLRITTKDWADFGLVLSLPPEKGKEYLKLFKSLNLVNLDEQNYIVTMDDFFIKVVSGETSTNRVRKFREKQKNKLLEAKEKILETDETLQGTDETLQGTDETIDKKREYKNDQNINLFYKTQGVQPWQV